MPDLLIGSKQEPILPQKSVRRQTLKSLIPPGRSERPEATFQARAAEIKGGKGWLPFWGQHFGVQPGAGRSEDGFEQGPGLIL